MEKRYDIIYAGEILPNHDPVEVRARLGKLFKADAATLDLLFSGREQSIKRDCDEQLARRYKQGMEQAGAKVIIRLSGGSGATKPSTQPSTQSSTQSSSQPSTQPSAQSATTGSVGNATSPRAVDAGSAARPDTAGKGSMADRVAALVGQPAPQESEVAARAKDTTTAAPNTANINLTPPGTPVLLESERAPTAAATVDTSSLALSPVGPLPAPPQPSPVSVSTEHLEVAEAGENLAPPATQETHSVPSTAGIALSPEGTDFSDCAPPPLPVLDLDLHDVAVAEAGEPLLEERYRSKSDITAPDTSHLSLDNSLDNSTNNAPH